MRLIDADALKDMLLKHGYTTEQNQIFRYIDEQPTAYDIGKVVHQMEKDKFIDCEIILSDVHQGYNAGLSRAIEIVKGGGADG